MKLPTGNAICYSGYREGQSPGDQVYPSKAQISEDLHLLHQHWRLLRLYDCSVHGERVLEVIRNERLDFKVMLGAHLGAEVNNEACPWGSSLSDAQLTASRTENLAETDRLIALAQRFSDIVFAVAVGNEATVDWTDHMVPVEQMIAHVRRVKQAVMQPVTFCENYVPWQHKLRDLVQELDFISVHTYPLWEYKTIAEALAYTQENVRSVSCQYPNKQLVISEAGWATRSNGRGMNADHATSEIQARYCTELVQWTRDQGILTFLFEAFDEPWKGSPDPLEPEKHWGLFTVDRQPKFAMYALSGQGIEAHRA